MNIFVLHPKPRKCARWHVDKHVVKMILETCQLLYTAHWALYYTDLQEIRSAIVLSRTQKQKQVPEYMKSAPLCTSTGEPTYRPCHIQHPCATWTRACEGNYRWLCELGMELVREYRFRYKKTHSCEKHMEWLSEHLPPTILQKERTDFAVAMADEYRISNDPIRCYRHYYRTQKAEKGIIQYSHRHSPHWISS
jgi:hypothetical protein